MTAKFYGTNCDTMVISNKGLFLVASQDREFGPGDYERIGDGIDDLPEGAVELTSWMLDPEMIDELIELTTILD